MPLHALGIKKPNSFYGVTFSDLMTVVGAVLFYTMPGVDRQVVMQWIIDHVFFGSVELCSVFGVFVFHKAFEWGGLGIYAFFYKYEKILGISHAKVRPDERWAWDNDDTTDKNGIMRKRQSDLDSRSVWYTIKFHACVSFVQMLILAFAVNWRWLPGAALQWSWQPKREDLRIADPATIPSHGTVAFQCLVGSFVAETGFYFAHRLLHETRLYYFHKRHHEHINSDVYATFYVSFFDALITDIIPVGTSVLLFNMHMWTVWMLTLPLIGNALRVHCGYDNTQLISALGVPASLGFDPTATLPLCTDSERTHDMHHRYNMCNYGGAYFLWDRLLGTWQDPDQEIVTYVNGKRIARLPTPPPAQKYDPDVADTVKTD